jgi:hypothetical protein
MQKIRLPFRGRGRSGICIPLPTKLSEEHGLTADDYVIVTIEDSRKWHLELMKIAELEKMAECA